MSADGKRTLDYATPVRHGRRWKWVILACAAGAGMIVGLLASRAVVVRVQQQRALQAQQAVLKALQTATTHPATGPTAR